MKNFIENVKAFILASMLVVSCFGIMYILDKSDVEQTKNQNIIIVKQDLPSRYGGWRVQEIQ